MFASNVLDDAHLAKHVINAACEVLAQDHPTETTILALCDALVEYEHRNGAAHWIDALVPVFVQRMEEIKNGPPF